MGHTVIQIPVPALELIAQQGVRTPVCPHITLLGPFVDQHEVDKDLVNTISEVLAPVRAFDFQLSDVAHFAERLIYLAPTPAEPFIRLTEMFSEVFPLWPPYGGAFDAVVPHLSIGEDLPETELAALRELLPIRTTANEVTLTWWSEAAAEVLARFPLSP
ncbi:MAG: 2'-5' RNA ligase family protein [Tessaracoccus sp.]|nr:2'-5' RNA ligase family protein [Tessaracoccus sp.]